MNTILSFTGIALILCFSYGCSSIFLHPLSTGSTIYHATPLKKDSTGGKLFAAAGLGSQLANRDLSFWGQGNIYYTHRIGMFSAYYAANISLGNYSVHSDISENQQSSSYDQYTGNHFFGSWGGAGGFNASVFTKRKGSIRGEWRFIGLHSAFQQDWGSYYKFRQLIQPGWADHFSKNNKLGIFGLSTELVMYHERKANVYSSIQLQYNFMLGNDYHFVYSDISSRLGYLSGAFYFNAPKSKSFVQLNVGSFNTISIFWGINFTLTTFKNNKN